MKLNKILSGVADKRDFHLIINLVSPPPELQKGANPS